LVLTASSVATAERTSARGHEEKNSRRAYLVGLSPLSGPEADIKRRRKSASSGSDSTVETGEDSLYWLRPNFVVETDNVEVSDAGPLTDGAAGSGADVGKPPRREAGRWRGATTRAQPDRQAAVL